MKNYIHNLETNTIELHFEKSDYMALSAEQKADIKSAFHWSRFAAAWVSKSKNSHYRRALQVANKLGFTTEIKQGKRLSYAEELERKTEKAAHRAERMEEHADNAAKRAEGMQAEFNQCRQDWSWLTQPVIAGHAGSQRFANQRQRVINRYKKGFDEYRKSDYFRERAETARNTASNTQLQSPLYIDNRINECKKEMSKIEKRIANNENALCEIEQGEVVKNYKGDVLTAERIQNGLKGLIEAYEWQADKMAFMYNALDKLKENGMKFYTKDDIKIGYLMKGRHGWSKITKINPKTVYGIYIDGGLKGMQSSDVYAEIRDVKIPDDWKDIKSV